jgi:DNA polymerase elongation subunit (family B)
MNLEQGTEITIDWEEGGSTVHTAAEVWHLIFDSSQPWVLSANGTIFRYDMKGIIPGLLERWYAERKEMQAKKKAATTPEDQAYWDKRQLVKKINLNSLYGAILNAGCRFFDKRIGQSTTLVGRSIAKHMDAHVNECLTGDYDHLGKSIIYGDTDSVYFSAWPIFKKDIEEGRMEWNKDVCIALYDTIADSVNDSFPGFMERAFHCPREMGAIIKGGRELIAEKGLFIKKKRYAVLIFDLEGKRLDVDGKPGKVKAMGLDLKRSDTPKFVQDFLSRILLEVLTGATKETIYEQVREFKYTFAELPAWEKGTPKRVNNLTKHTDVYKKTGKCGVGHAMAAINWNRFKEAFGDRRSMDITDGQKAIVCKLRSNPMQINSIAYPIDELNLPDWFKQLPFDHDAMEETIIDSKIENLLGVLKWDLNASKDRGYVDDIFS